MEMYHTVVQYNGDTNTYWFVYSRVALPLGVLPSWNQNRHYLWLLIWASVTHFLRHSPKSQWWYFTHNHASSITLNEFFVLIPLTGCDMRVPEGHCDALIAWRTWVLAVMYRVRFLSTVLVLSILCDVLGVSSYAYHMSYIGRWLFLMITGLVCKLVDLSW